MRKLLLIITIASLISSFAQEQRGKASYYSRKATGSRTSSGERLHHDSLTCAHRTLPFGTLLKVRNLSNGKEVIVKVTDRGPFRRGRVVDLSWAAAKELGMLSQGIATVEVSRYTGTQVPFRNNDSIVAPFVEFDFSALDYNDVESWAEQNVQRNIEQVKNKKKIIKKKANTIKNNSIKTKAEPKPAVPYAKK